MTTTAINSERIGFKLNRGKGYWVSKNEDGTLLISLDGKFSFENAGSLINSLGGIDAVLAECEKKEITAENFNAEKFPIITPSEEELAQRMDFYNSLLQNENHIGSKHTPVKGNDGFRFAYPFTNVRFDSVKGWQYLRPMFGWQSTGECATEIAKLRIHFGLGPAEGFEECYERVKSNMNWRERRNQEITEAYNAIKDLRPVPATIENITAILEYYKMQGFVGDLLPMTIGYSCNDYDCDGKYAVAMKLDKPIVVNEEGEMSDRIACGAPRGHLSKYYRV